MPFRARPIQPVGYDDGLTWPQWLVDDQREASGRPDVVAFVSDVLTAPVKISGQPIANLVASTSGTDSDWVVKLIDVYPDEVAGQPAHGRLSADGLGRHLPRPLSREPRDAEGRSPPTQPLLYRFALPTANHVFLPGHRIMVQVQSSWFPLYDRNPQTFVPNIFWAKPGGLPEGDAADLPRARPGELRRAARRHRSLRGSTYGEATPVLRVCDRGVDRWCVGGQARVAGPGPAAGRRFNPPRPPHHARLPRAGGAVGEDRARHLAGRGGRHLA